MKFTKALRLIKTICSEKNCYNLYMVAVPRRVVIGSAARTANVKAGVKILVKMLSGKTSVNIMIVLIRRWIK